MYKMVLREVSLTTGIKNFRTGIFASRSLRLLKVVRPFKWFRKIRLVTGFNGFGKNPR
jgi:hypothetical protein